MENKNPIITKMLHDYTILPTDIINMICEYNYFDKEKCKKCGINYKIKYYDYCNKCNIEHNEHIQSLRKSKLENNKGSDFDFNRENCDDI